MKKIFTFMAAALMAATAFAAKETVLDVNYAELAVANVTYGSKIDIVRNENDKNKVNGTDMYPFSFGTVLAENAVMVSRGDGMLRYADVRNLGMFNNNKNFYGIKALQAGDVVEIAYNGGGSSDGTMKAVPEMTDLFNVTLGGETNTYTLQFTYNESARTLDYTVYTMTVKQDGPIAFALQTAYIAYIKIIRGEDDPEPEVEYEAQMDVNFAAFAASKIGTLGGSNITPTFGEQVNKVNTNVYSISVEGLLEAEKLFVNRNSDMLVRYSDVRSIGLYSKSTLTFVIPDLKKDDIVEIAWNAGGKSDGTYYTIDSTLTSLVNIAETGEWGKYAFTHTSGGTERTINYSTRQLKVAADGDVRFAIPSVQGDGSNWKIYIAYIKVLREKEQGPGTPTAIDDVKEASKAVKTIENGQVIILRDGVKYNLLGTRL